MAVAAVTVAYTLEAALYDGANGSDIADWLGDATFVSEGVSGVVLEMSYGGEITIAPNRYVVRKDSYSLEGDYSPTDFSNKFKIVPSNIAYKVGVGLANIPTLVGAAQTTIAVNLSDTFSSNSYDANAVILGGTGDLAQLYILSTDIVDGNSVDVVVKNNGLLTLSGAQVQVIAFGS